MPRIYQSILERLVFKQHVENTKRYRSKRVLFRTGSELNVEARKKG